MTDGDYRMPPEDHPDTLGSSGSDNSKGFGLPESLLAASALKGGLRDYQAPAPEDQPLPPEETPPGSYIYTAPKKRSWKNFRKKVLAMYGAAAGIAVLLLTNVIPLYHTENKVLPGGNLKIRTVLTSFAGWEDPDGRILVFNENGTGCTWQDGLFGTLTYTGGEESVTSEMGWVSHEEGEPVETQAETRLIDNSNLKEEGMSYVLTLLPGQSAEEGFRPLNFLPFSTKNADLLLRCSLRDLFDGTEWTVVSDGTDTDPKTVRVKVTDGPDGEKLMIDGPDPAEADLLVTDDGYQLSCLDPQRGWQILQPVTPIVPPDERPDETAPPDETKETSDDPDETEEPTETEEPAAEPVNVLETLTSVPGWVSDDGVYYVFREDGTGWVFTDGYFGTMSFEGDETSVDLATLLTMEDLSYSDEKEELISTVTKHEFYHTVTGDAFSEKDGVMTVILGKPDLPEDALFRPAETLPDTTWLDLFLAEGFTGLNRSGYWFIVDEYIPESSYPVPYTEFISFESETALLFVFQTTEPVEFTTEYAFEVSCGPVDPSTFEYAIEEPMSLGYKALDPNGQYSSYTHTQDPKTGHIRLIIKEDGLYVYADVPMGRPNLYRYTEN